MKIPLLIEFYFYPPAFFSSFSVLKFKIMSRKTDLTIHFYCAIANAILINLQLLSITNLNWWFVFSPTFFIVGMHLMRGMHLMKGVKHAHAHKK